ncbi:MAG TPA: OsmC family protein [Rhizomicrobium sp.]|jgi:putative redox protein|nr:OsmC family protein [Rhizomicrobium sp.]
MTADKPSDSETVLVAETGLGKYQVEARMGDAALLIDEPVAAGGLGSGPNPYDLISAAVGACTTMTVRLYANHKGWPLSRVRAAVRHSRASLQAKDRFELAITLEGDLDAAQRTRLMEIAERCPVHLTLARGSEVQARLMPKEKVVSMRPIESAGHMSCMEEACAD